VNKKILVIDDDARIRESIARQLRDLPGLAIDFESNPIEALRRFGRIEYDLVLCDIKMKPVSGMQVLGRLRSLYPRIPVIILTGFVDDQIIEAAHRMGCSDFLIKPVRKQQLVDSIQGVLGRLDGG
jgi:CheY-like chemotaxis protein